jgi:iron(III) transport system permease protein
VVLFLRSLGMSMAVSLISFSIAIPLTTFIQNQSDVLRRKLSQARWLLVSLILIPPYIHALAWMDFLARFSAIVRHLGMSWRVQGIALTIWVWVMALLPCATGISILALESVQPDLFEAARLLQNDLSGFLRVLLPLASPGLLAGSGFILLFCLLDYSVASLFGVQVYSLEIFADYSTYGQTGRAIALSLPLILAAVTWILVMMKALRPALQTPVLYQPPGGQILRWPTAWKFAQNLALLVVFLQVAVPLLSLLILVGSWEAFYTAFQTSQTEMWYSFSISSLTVVAALPLGILISASLQRQSRMSEWLWVGVLVPFLVPAPLIGILLIELQNLFPRFVDPGPILPAVAALIRFTPLAAVALVMQRRRINPAYIEAAQILQGHRLKTFWSVILPLLIPGLLVAIGVVFSLTLGELGATLMVAPPGRSTLALKIYNYLHYGASDQVASLCLLVTFLTIAVVGLCFWLYRAVGHRKNAGIEVGID